MRKVNIANLPSSMSPSQVRDEVWLRQMIPAPPPESTVKLDPVVLHQIEQVDDLLLRLMDMTQRLYTARQTLVAAQR